MEHSDFKAIYESLGLTVRDVMRITGKTRNTLDKWSQEGVVKDPAAATLFRLAATLQRPPFSYHKKEIVNLLFQSAGDLAASTVIDYSACTNDELTELKECYIDRLAKLSSNLKSMNLSENQPESYKTYHESRVLRSWNQRELIADFWKIRETAEREKAEG